MKFVTMVMVAFVLGFSALAFYALSLPDVYTGKAVFNSEEEYGVFKEAVISEEVDILSLDVLSSNPPIIVNFSIEVPQGASFKFGDKATDNRIGGIIALCGAIGLLGCAFWVQFSKEE